MKAPISFNIDVVGSCNLRCPSCPIGNSQDVDNARGTMSPELLSEILKKASSEVNISFIGLFNWTEPLIHPRLAQLVEIAETYAPCHISSNLNLKKVDFDELLSKNPYYFRISLSGFNQSTYSKTHQGGNIEVVKNNMILLAESKKRVNSNTIIEVLYHRYLGNLDDEILIREFAKILGFLFKPVWAYMMPIEKSMLSIYNPTKLSEQDNELLKKIALPPSKQVLHAAKKQKVSSCTLLDDQITLNLRGEVQLCCAVYDQDKYTVTDFLSQSFSEIQELKKSYSICNNCMENGLHVLATYGSPEFDEIAFNNISEHYRKNTGLNLYIGHSGFNRKFIANLFKKFTSR